MSQLSLAASISTTLQFPTNIAAMTGVNALIAVTTSAAHGLSTGDIVQISGVASPAGAANGQWVITVTSSTAFTLNNSLGSGTWASGGTVEHIGRAAAGVLVDNSVFAGGFPVDAVWVTRVEAGPQWVSAGARFVLEDAADSAFLTEMTAAAVNLQGVTGTSSDRVAAVSFRDVADLRVGSSGDHIRVKILFGNAVPGVTWQFSSWISS